jgi:hypothetical protein
LITTIGLVWCVVHTVGVGVHYYVCTCVSIAR